MHKPQNVCMMTSIDQRASQPKGKTMANEFGYTLQTLPGTLASVQEAEQEMVQFGRNAGTFGHVCPCGWEANRQLLISLLERAISINNQTYLDAIAFKLWSLETGVWYIPPN